MTTILQTAMDSRRVVIVPVVPRTKPSVLQRIYLDGFLEIHKSKCKRIKAFWWVTLILSYLTAASLAYLLVSRYWSHKKIIQIINLADIKSETVQEIYFPQITVCHTGDWNKTYMIRNVNVPVNIKEKAIGLGMETIEDLLEKFSLYISHYAVINHIYHDFDNETWNLMTELFHYNFRDVEFSDFLMDAAMQGKQTIRNCEFKKKPFRCSVGKYALDMPSCFVVPILDSSNNMQYLGQSFQNDGNLNFNFELTISKHDLFPYNSENKLGVRMTLGSPGPFSNQLYIPANTHAVIEFENITTQLETNCTTSIGLSKFFHLTPYSYEICILEAIENEIFQSCGCYFIASEFIPKNGIICTPDQMVNCVRPKAFGAFESNEAEVSFFKERCIRSCHKTQSDITSMTFHNLDDTGGTVRNIFTLRPREDRKLLHMEKNLYDVYNIICEVGGALGVYTGISGVAFIQAVVLIAGASIKIANKNIIKPWLSRRLDGAVPLSILWDTGKGHTCRYINISRTKRVVRVTPI